MLMMDVHQPLCKKKLSFGDDIFNESDDEPLIYKCLQQPLTTSPNQATIQDLDVDEMAHKMRLDNLLSSNGLTQNEVARDGNCFFSAAATCLPDLDGQQLRQQLCDYLERNFKNYINFTAAREDDNDRELLFLVSLQELRQPGVWNNDVGDLMPKVLADWSNKPVYIYSSNPFKAVLHIEPDGWLSPLTSATEIINLAFLDYHPSHYDACIVLSKDTSQQIGDGNIQKEVPSSQAQATSAAPNAATPRKQGTYSTPVKKTTVRKRSSNRAGWKQKYVKKQLHLEGKEYIGSGGKVVPAKAVQPINCTNCHFTCSKLITEDQRHSLFKAFYSLESFDRQKDFVSCSVTESPTQDVEQDGIKKVKRRNKCRQYHFTVDDKQIRVCKKFFLATLNIGQKYVEHTLQNSHHGLFSGFHRIGKTPHNKTTVLALELIREHIKSFPVVESHYTRKDTQRLYLPSDLTIRKMHFLYKDFCKNKNQKPSTERVYRQVFNIEFNYSFHAPKKDQCPLCVGFHLKEKQCLNTSEDRYVYEEHTKKKQEARNEKAADKARASKDPAIHVLTMDFQAVLQSPCGMVGPLYYKRKLCVYNFKLYDLVSGRGTCFTWDETEGKRGSCEISTCVYYYVSTLPKSVSEVIIYSDCCGGQNRNQYLATALVHAVNHITNIQTITHKYLETGHTQMECDSMHAAITFAKKSTPIYTPSGWDIVLRMARRKTPYTVIPLKHTDMLDFKKLASSVMRNTKSDLNGRKVNWLHIKALRVVKGHDDLILLKYSFTEGNWTHLKFMGSSKRARPSLKSFSEIPKCYSSKLPVSEAKKNDLLSLCNCNPPVIPQEYHSFYRALPTSSYVVDKLPVPDLTEEEHDSD